MVSLKNLNIIEIDKNILSQIDFIREVIFNNQSYKDFTQNNNYLN